MKLREDERRLYLTNPYVLEKKGFRSFYIHIKPGRIIFAVLRKLLEKEYNDNNSNLTVEQNVHNRHHGLGISAVELHLYSVYLLYGSHYRRCMQINVVLTGFVPSFMLLKFYGHCSFFSSTCLHSFHL